MAKKITLEKLMMPLIDDAANVFYSKLVSMLDAMWGQLFVLKSWCGWHSHRRVGFKWKYGAFSSYATDRKCVVNLNTVDPDILKDKVTVKKDAVKKTTRIEQLTELITIRALKPFILNMTAAQRDELVRVFANAKVVEIIAVLKACEVLTFREKVELMHVLAEADRVDMLDTMLENLDVLDELKDDSLSNSERQKKIIELWTFPSIVSGNNVKVGMTLRMAMLLLQETVPVTKEEVEEEEKLVVTNKKKYLRAVYIMDMSKVIVDTTESTLNTGGAPVPTYRLDTDIPLTLFGYTVSTDSRDFVYGKGIGSYVVKTEGTDGDAVEKFEGVDFEAMYANHSPYVTVLIGRVSLFADECVMFDPIYNHGMLDDISFNLNKKTTIYSSTDTETVEGLNTHDVSQGTKYEWDCGRAFEYCLDGKDADGNLVQFWKYYTIDSDGMKWLMESSDRTANQKPEVMLPFLNNLCDTSYFLDGACFKMECVDEETLHFIIYVWKMSSHVYRHEDADMFMKFTQNKAHQRKKFVPKRANVESYGLKKYNIAKLSRFVHHFLYTKHEFMSSAYNTENDHSGILRELFNNSVFFDNKLLCDKSAYDIGKNYPDEVLEEINADAIILLIMAVSNISVHYLFNGAPNDTLSYPVLYAMNKNNIASYDMIKHDMKYMLNITKYATIVSDMSWDASTNSPKYSDASWDKIITPYIFIKDATIEEYQSQGGTLVKFVNLGTEENPHIFTVERKSTTKGDYGLDKKDKTHTFDVNSWTVNDTHTYTPTYQMYTVPGMYSELFRPHAKGSVMDIKKPTRNIQMQLDSFYNNMAVLFGNESLDGEGIKPRSKYALIRRFSFTQFFEGAEEGRYLRLRKNTDSETGFTYLCMGG